MTLESRLKKTLRKVRSQYAKPEEKPAKAADASGKSKKKKVDPGAQISDPVILTK